MFWDTKLKFAGLTIPRFMAAPIDGITDSPFRQMIRKFSKDELLYTEMRHISAVAYEKSRKSLKFKQIEQPLAFQVSANSIKFLERAIESVIENKFIQINLNAGCPAKNVIKSGTGSALMGNIPLLKEILTALNKAINNRVPLTIKIRAGFKEKNGLEIAQIAEDFGLQGIIIHPRTQPQGFSSPLDFDLVKKIKQTVKIPVIFSGNINSFARAKQAYELTGVDGFMIGRALWGAPWKIKKIREEGLGNKFEVTTEERLKLAIEHLELNNEFYEINGFQAFKKQLPQYIKNLENAAKAREELLRTQSFEEMKTKLEKLLKEEDRNNASG